MLFPRFLMLDEDARARPPGTRVFYAVSAFNNAGFVPTAEGLAPFVSDWWVLLPIILGVFIGSLGFPVILNVARHLRDAAPLEPAHQADRSPRASRSSWSASVLVAAFEWTNPGTFGRSTPAARSSPSLFAGVMPRSGGFSTVDVGEMHEGTWLLIDALMFVGGGRASTAGGIKVTTLAVMLLAIVAEAPRRPGRRGLRPADPARDPAGRDRRLARLGDARARRRRCCCWR